jgi:hypothetical protein
MKTYIFLLAAILFAGPSLMANGDPIKMETDPIQRLDVRFRLFKTQNVYTHLLLDTATGAIWQLQWSIDEKASRGCLAIRDTPLLPKGEQPAIGRFALYPTANMFNFILLDTDTGRTWQCQWSLDASPRGLFVIPDLSLKKEDK